MGDNLGREIVRLVLADTFPASANNETALIAQIDDMIAERLRLLEAVAKAAKLVTRQVNLVHPSDCQRVKRPGWACDCGLDALVKALAAVEAGN